MTMVPRRIDRPEPGFWLVRLAGARSPVTPAAIERRAVEHEPGAPDNDMRGTRSATLVGFIAGRECHPDDVWIRDAEPITKDEYQFRIADLAWCRDHAPNEPIAQPYRRTDWTTAPPPF